MSDVKPEIQNTEIDPKLAAVEVFLNGKPPVIADPAPAVEPEAVVEDDFFGWTDEEKNLAADPVADSKEVILAPIATNQESPVAAIAKKLGVEAKSEEELIEAISRMKATPIVIGGDETTQSINRLLASDDKTLVTEAMRNDGWKDEEIAEYFDKSEDIHVKKEARLIRSGLNDTLKNYSNSIEDKRKAEDAKRLADIANQKQQLKDYQSKTDTFMGLKLGRTAEEVKATNDKLYNYVTSGQFEQEVFSSPENVQKAAWLFKNAEAFAKANYNRGLNAAKKTVLGNMEVPDHAGMQPQLARSQEKQRTPQAFFEGLKK